MIGHTTRAPRFVRDTLALLSRVRKFRKVLPDTTTPRKLSPIILYQYQLDGIMSVVNNWMGQAQIEIKAIRGIRNVTPVFVVPEILPVDPYGPDSFAAPQDANRGYTVEAGAPSVVPVGSYFVGSFRVAPLGGIVRPGPIRPRPWPPGPPLPPQPDPLPPLYWLPVAEEDYSFVYSFRVAINDTYALPSIGRNECRNLAYYLIGFFQHYYELYRHRNSEDAARIQCRDSVDALKELLFKG